MVQRPHVKSSKRFHFFSCHDYFNDDCVDLISYNGLALNVFDQPKQTANLWGPEVGVSVDTRRVVKGAVQAFPPLWCKGLLACIMYIISEKEEAPGC